MNARVPAAPHSSAALEALRALLARSGWAASLAAYALFAAATFVALGPEPLLGPDHLTYFQLADTIAANCPAGDYWRETDPVRNFAIALAYLNPLTGDPVLSMKLVLAVSTVFYLLAAELFFALFHADRLRAMLFALVSAFAVSFGVTSWGVTDSTALLPRTLVAPVMMVAIWLWMRFDTHPARYLAFPLLVLGSLLHLSAFYLAGVLVLVELWDWIVLRRFSIDRLVPSFAAGLVAAAGLQVGLEQAGLASKAFAIQIPHMARSMGFDIPNADPGAKFGCQPAAKASRDSRGSPTPQQAASADAHRVAFPSRTAAIPAAPAVPHADSAARTAKEAWDIELALRPWRNMPLPLVNVANLLASSALVLALAFAGMMAARRDGFTRADGLMLGMFVMVPVFAFGPQTLLWWLRSFTDVYPVTIEEVRAIGLIMIPALYFVSRLYARVAAGAAPRAGRMATLIVVAALVLPLAMKSLPRFAREAILAGLGAAGVVNPSIPSSLANARSALGLAATRPLFYATRGARAWLAAHARPGERVLTDRDDFVLLRDLEVLGPRQVGATSSYVTPEQARLFTETVRAYGTRDTDRVLALARSLGADFAVVGWPVSGAVYSDADFSVLRMGRGPGGAS